MCAFRAAKYHFARSRSHWSMATAFQIDRAEAAGNARGQVAVFVADDGSPTIFDNESVSKMIADRRPRGNG